MMTEPCRVCGTKLAGDNSGGVCGSCKVASRGRPELPPEVPDEFWEIHEMQAALAAEHMGRVIRAYRHHPHHGRRPLSQEVVGRWVGRSQAAISRLEVGSPPTELQELRYWAHLLRIPERYLWFTVSGASRRPAGLDSLTVKEAHRLQQLAALLDEIVGSDRSPKGLADRDHRKASAETPGSLPAAASTAVPSAFPGRGDLHPTLDSQVTEAPMDDTRRPPAKPQQVPEGALEGTGSSDDGPGYVDPGGIPMTAEEYAQAPTLPRPPITIDIHTAQNARMADYLLGGEANFSVDRETIEYVTSVLPGGMDTARLTVREGQAFVDRVVRYLAADIRLRQFVNIGPVVPSGTKVHEVAQSVAASSHVVYVINDDVMLAHAHQLKPVTKEGRTSYIRATLRDVGKLITQAGKVIDFDQPTGIIIQSGGLNIIANDADAEDAVAALLEHVAPRSYVAITQLGMDLLGSGIAAALDRHKRVAAEGRMPSLTMRNHDQVRELFTGLEFVGPGVVPVDQWHPGKTEGEAPRGAANTFIYGGVGYKP